MEKIESKIITTEEACKLLKVTRQTLYKLVETGKIPGKKIGRDYRFHEDDILNYISADNDNLIVSKEDSPGVKKWILKDNFATVGIKKMAKRTFQEFSSNVEELIVNAYDEDATSVEIILDLDKSNLSITDNGNGMNEDDLIKYVIYGESNKTSAHKSPKFQRSPIGEYGMGGKLAISNLCKLCKVVTKRDGKEHIFNMDKSILDKAKYVTDIKRVVITKNCDKDLCGTSIFMSDLLYKKVDYERFLEKLSERMPMSQNFKIYVTITKDNSERKYEIEEPKFDAEKEFYYEENSKLIGQVNLKVYYTKEPILATKQGIWTKVNGRIVNEKQEWFGLLNFTSGQRYRWRLYGIGNADGLKDYVTFSKNDFIDCPEYREYYNFVHNCLKEVQNTLLKADEDIKKEKQRESVKKVENEINKVVAELDKPEVIKEMKDALKKDIPPKIEKKAAEEGKEANAEEILEELKNIVDKGKERREKRKNKFKKEDKVAYEDKAYLIETVDMSSGGDLIRFTSEKNLIEINERHPFYIEAGNEGHLENLVRNLAYMEIARDYSEGNDLIFDDVFNKLTKLSLEFSKK